MDEPVRPTDVRAAVDAAWRAESARIVAVVARRVNDLALAEDAAQDALLSALEHWPREGVPSNPAAWLTTTAIHRALDRVRGRTRHARKHGELAADLDAREAHVVPDIAETLAAASEDDIGDDLLRLIFTACHPVLPAEARVALTLRVLGGLTTGEIARAFLVPEATVAQRIVRAKRALTASRVPFEVPDASARVSRLASVLEVVYLIFNEGYTATAGDDWIRPALTDEALRLGRLLAVIADEEPEAHGLLALMELQASRQSARTDGDGRPVLLPDQDRRRWDAAAIRRGLDALDAAGRRARDARRPDGPYTLQAAIAACHARADHTEATDWARIVGLYDRLLSRTPSPVVALNRAVAVGMAHGPDAALPLVDALAGEPALAGYPWLHSVRGDLLARLGRHGEAHDAFRRAAEATHNARDREVLAARARQSAALAAAAG